MKYHNLFIGLGFFAVFFATQGVTVLAIPYYHMTVKVDPFYLGLSITLPMVVGALLSPVVGDLFDKNPAFRNKPLLILIFGWLTSFLFGSVWMAPVDWEQKHILIYVLTILTALSISLCFLTLALKCLVFEKLDNHNDRSTQFGVNAFFEKLGAIVYFWLFPLAHLFFQGDIHEGVRAIGWIIGIFIIGGFCTLLSLHFLSLAAPTKVPASNDKISQQFIININVIPKTIRINTYYALTQAFIMFAVLGLCVSFDYYLIVYYMHAGDVIQGSFWKGVLSTAYAIFGILYIPILLRLRKNKSSYIVLRYAYILAFIGGPLKWIIFSPDNDIFLLVDALFGAVAWAAIAMMIPTILGNISEHAEKHHAIKIHGWLNARHNFVLLTSAVIALAASGLILNLSGFDAAALDQDNASALQTIRYIFALGTSAVFIVLFILTFHNQSQSNAV